MAQIVENFPPTAVTFKQLKRFIAFQPDERSVNMRQPTYGYTADVTTGCIMVHYGREVLNLVGPFGCSCRYWAVGKIIVALGDDQLHSFMQDMAFENFSSYGQVKEFLLASKTYVNRSKLSVIELIHSN